MTCSSSLKFTGGKRRKHQKRGGSSLYKGGMSNPLQPLSVGGVNTDIGGTAYGTAAFGGFNQVSNPATGGVLTNPNAYGGVTKGGRRRSRKNGALTRFVRKLRKTISRRSRRCRRRR